MARNFLKGIVGDEINVMLAAAAMNFKRVMNLCKAEAIISWQLIIKFLMFVYRNSIALKLNLTF